MVIPLNRYHTHEEIVRRKKRVRKNVPAASNMHDKIIIKTEHSENSASTTGGNSGGGIDVAALGMHLKYEEIVADVTEIVQPPPIVITKK